MVLQASCHYRSLALETHVAVRDPSFSPPQSCCQLFARFCASTSQYDLGVRVGCAGWVWGLGVWGLGVRVLSKIVRQLTFQVVMLYCLVALSCRIVLLHCLVALSCRID